MVVVVVWVFKAQRGENTNSNEDTALAQDEEAAAATARTKDAPGLTAMGRKEKDNGDGIRSGTDRVTGTQMAFRRQYANI